MNDNNKNNDNKNDERNDESYSYAAKLFVFTFFIILIIPLAYDFYDLLNWDYIVAKGCITNYENDTIGFLKHVLDVFKFALIRE